jgi:ribulose-phosphate 3-epimerase
VTRVHLDVADGVFVPRRTVLGHEQLRRMETDLIFDIHLMVSRPEEQCRVWCNLPHADRFLVHIESTERFADISRHAREHGRRLGAALNPETNPLRLEPVLPHIEVVQFMSVYPGAQGRAFVPEVLDQVTEFHAAHPDIPIMMDGGITPQTAPRCVRAGACCLVSGSYVMRASDFARALRELAAAVASVES